MYAALSWSRLEEEEKQGRLGLQPWRKQTSACGDVSTFRNPRGKSGQDTCRRRPVERGAGFVWRASEDDWTRNKWAWLADVWAQSVAPARTVKGIAREAHTPRQTKSSGSERLAESSLSPAEVIQLGL
ncbi:hypothetical protein PR001_g10127 [Phytophthora rubi]|uniref:Uncharacterized protein n=1 Tax=Phytophthora rubi TaxID=129364 RepID=A0A6A3MPM8_9STRA|nr:hypothetical protein PR001_g10127 [Phytophthora rubi]